ncbi:MAG: PilZ domain-containing protein [Desulfohalobiaceae bacterium]
MSNQQESRTFSRIPTRITAYARRVESEKDSPLFHGKGSAPRPSPQKLKEANIPEGVKDFLQAIDKKVDMLISFISRDLLKEEFPVKTDVVELSGAGLKMVTPGQGLSLGDTVEVVLLLGQYPLNLAGAIGVLRRTEDLHGTSVLVMEFTRIRESDREAIVQFVFQEQREQIRENRYEDS